ncbi:cytochrome P450 [Xylogone sp. PMI_703]|nr:cytochrome P450 [Xylogone sp. PMI_703]
MSLSSACLYAIGAGFLSHIAYFKHGEHVTDGLQVIQTFTLATITIFIIYLQSDWNLLTALTYTIAIDTSFLLSLFTSIFIYRVFLHRTRSFPGPFWAGVSKMYISYHSYPRFDSFRRLEKLHKQYGNFVHIGPNEIAIFDPAAVPVISKFKKGPFYASSDRVVTIQRIRDPKLHAQRRRVWDKGFNAKALKSYEDRVETVIQTFVREMYAHSGNVLNLHEWLLWTMFDSMGSVVFGRPFGTIERRGHPALDILDKSVLPIAILGPIPWALNLMRQLPGTHFNVFAKLCADFVDERAHETMEDMDVMGNLIDVYRRNPTPEELARLHADSRFAVLAGTETTLVALVYLFYYLAKQPEQQTKLRTELLNSIREDPRFYVSAKRNSPHLDAAINEILRLWHGVLSGIQHVTPPEGAMINKTWIPGGVNVTTPFYVVHRLESSYPRAEEFIPERWYSQPELIKDNNGYAPFSLGPASCPGKQLGLFQMRAFVTHVLTRFSVEFAPGIDEDETLTKTTDRFAHSPGPLKVILTPL